MASISKTVRPKRSNNAAVSPLGEGLAASRGTPTVQGISPPASAALTGTASSTWYETDVVAGGDTIIISLSATTWVASGATFDAQRQNILNGLVAASSPTNGWNNRRADIPVTAVVRPSSTVCTITRPAIAAYSVTANETITCTVPSTATAAGTAIVASPTLTVTEGAGSGGSLTDDGYYISTYEPVDANTLMADDFSRGAWYTKNYDEAMSSGGLGQTGVHGWGGTIYANPITPPGAITGGGVGLHGREYAANGGYHTGLVEGGRNMADHSFVGEVGVTEAYFRLYFKPLADYNGGHEKMFDFTRGGAGSGQLFALGYNYFGGETFAFMSYNYQDTGLGPSPGHIAWMPANLTAPLTFTPTHWHYVEIRIRLNTSDLWDGICEWWMDDCGVDGTSGPATPTKRASYTNVKFRGSDTGTASDLIRGIWIENWANAPTTGTMYYANVYVSRAFIGFANPAHQP